MTAGHTILIIEDEASLQAALRDKFQGEGFTVHVAKNGDEGLEFAQKRKPDIILLDLVMPVLDGIAMLKKLREDEWGKTASVIALTNLSGKEELDKAIEGGVYDYLIKSDWKLEDVVAKVKEKLGIE